VSFCLGFISIRAYWSLFYCLWFWFGLICLFVCFCFFLDQLILACGGWVNGAKGKEDLKKVKEILSQYASLLNEELDGCGSTPLILASIYNCVSIVEFLLSFDDIEVNKGTKVR
jgi:hypothetical protein